MGWPLVFAFFATVAVFAALYGVATRRFRVEKQALSCGSIIKRFFLLLAICEKQWRFPSIYQEEEWKPFYERIKRVLEEVQAAGRPYPQRRMDDDRVLRLKRVCEAIDRYLVSYLQSQTELAEWLKECLPASGQSWDSIPTRAGENLEYESDSLDNESESSDNGSDFSFQDDVSEEKLPEALEDMMELVGSILHDLDETNSSVSAGATRGETGLASVQVSPDYIPVYYATDRQMTEDGEYSGTRSGRLKLHHGRMTVAIPGCAKGLKIPDPSKHEEADPCLHFVIFSMNTELRDNEDGFVEILGKKLQQEAEGNQERKTNAVLLYIHGFNVSHKEAIKRAARLKRDINFKGEVIVYSWSSYGVLSWPAYYHDADNIKETVGLLTSFIETITTKIPGDPDVHIVAHSMGNRGLIEALKQARSIAPTMKNVVFAAADVGRQRFDDMVRKVQTADSGSDHQQRSGREKLSARSPLFTVYSSNDDQALFASKYVNWSKGRLGDTRMFLDMGAQEKGSDQVDVTGRKVTKAWLHHSYYGKIPEVLEDIEDLVTKNMNAERRSCQPEARIKPVTHKGKKFFAFDDSVWHSEQRCW